jgi:hypothetical protein
LIELDPRRQPPVDDGRADEAKNNVLAAHGLADQPRLFLGKFDHQFGSSSDGLLFSKATTFAISCASLNF